MSDAGASKGEGMVKGAREGGGLMWLRRPKRNHQTDRIKTSSNVRSQEPSVNGHGTLHRNHAADHAAKPVSSIPVPGHSGNRIGTPHRPSAEDRDFGSPAKP